MLLFSNYFNESRILERHRIGYQMYFDSRILLILKNRFSHKKRDLYGKTLVKIPVPHFVVFYNGKDHAPEHYTLRLSDAFERETDAPEIELVCHVYNINKGNNTELLAKCSILT